MTGKLCVSTQQIRIFFKSGNVNAGKGENGSSSYAVPKIQLAFNPYCLKTTRLHFTICFRVGDYLLSINNTELTGLPDSKVQQILRLLPRGLSKIIASAVPPEQSDSTSKYSVCVCISLVWRKVFLCPQNNPKNLDPHLSCKVPGRWIYFGLGKTIHSKILQGTLFTMTAFVPKHSDVKLNLLLQRIHI